MPQIMRLIALINSLLFCFMALNAQDKAEVLELLSETSDSISSYSLQEIHDDISVVKGTLYFYKNFVSSQDASSCSFSPSCSEYAVLAVKKQGLIKGLINFADRFQRCNGKSPQDYEYIKEKHLLYDPVRDAKYNEL